MSDSEQHSDTDMIDVPPPAKRPSSPSMSDRSSKSQRTKEEADVEDSAQPGSTLSATAPAFVPSIPAPKIPAKIEANVHKLIAAGLSDATINARLASTAARHGIPPYQFNPSQLALARANFAAAISKTVAGKSGAVGETAQASTSSTGAEGTRPVKPIPAKPLSMRAGAKTYLPEQAKVPKTKEERENSRRLIVVLSKVRVGRDLSDDPPGSELILLTCSRCISVLRSQACLEVYRSNRPSANGAQVRDTLLNCDDHQGFLAKEGRDIADARPDITHQVSVTRHRLPLERNTMG